MSSYSALKDRIQLAQDELRQFMLSFDRIMLDDADEIASWIPDYLMVRLTVQERKDYALREVRTLITRASLILSEGAKAWIVKSPLKK